MRYQTSSRSGWWTRYSQYLKSPEWKKKRQRLYRDRKGKCEDCGKKLKGEYHAHHKTYARMGDEDLDDLELLCDSCHQRRHPDKKIARRRRPVKKRVLIVSVLALLPLVLLAILYLTY